MDGYRPRGDGRHPPPRHHGGNGGAPPLPEPGPRGEDPTRVRVPDHYVQRAIDYLIESSSHVEQCVLRVERAEAAVDEAYDEAFLQAPRATFPTEAERKSYARTTSAYRRARAELGEARSILRGHLARRETAENLIRAWQSVGANMRATRI